MADRHADGLRSLERTFTLIILLGCAISLYLSTVSTPMGRSFGKMGKGYVFHADKGHGGRGMFMFQDHRHKDIFNRPRSTRNLSLESGVVTPAPTESPDLTNTWFSPVNTTVRTFAHEKHPNYFKYIINNQNLCKDVKVDILVYFHSATKNIQTRRILRETWANRNIFKNITIKTIFILGQSADNLEQLKIQNEVMTYGDIVQGSFVDKHQNLTLKAIMATRWITEFCPHARYVIKADDDIFVNIFAFVEHFIPKIYQKKKTVMCHLKQKDTNEIVRDKRSKWYVPENLLVGKKYFPQFCSGYVLLFTGDLAPDMYKESFNTPLIPIDDAYLFGLTLEKVKDVEFINIQSNFTLNQKKALEEYQSGDTLSIVASNAWQAGVMEKFWFYTLDRLSAWAMKHSSYSTLAKRRKVLKLNAR